MNDIPDKAIQIGVDRVVALGYLPERAAYKVVHGEILDAVKLIDACGGNVIWRDDK